MERDLMAKVGDNIEISGKVNATTTGEFTVAINEIYVDEQWRKFNPVKEIVVKDTDYDTSLTPQELKLVQSLAEKNKESSVLTDDEQVLAKSIVAKLSVVSE